MTIEMEDFWENLLDLIEEGNILPVVGQGVTTMEPDDSLLAPWLAAKVAEKLEIASSKLPAQPTLHDVVCRYLIDGAESDDDVRRSLNSLLKHPPEPGLTLRRLASIGGFRLFISTTFDPLLTSALNSVRHNNQPLTSVHAYSPGHINDLPKRRHELRGSTVFHLMGKVSASTDYVVWEEDILEFICTLHQRMSAFENLRLELEDPTLRVLLLGLNYADWGVRFFLRVLRQGRLSEKRRVDYLTDGPTGTLPDSMVMFFGDVGRRGGAVKNIKVIPLEPRDFVAELARRWADRHPPATILPGQPIPPPDEMPEGAIFISYAREDEAAVQTLKRGLEWYGCEVWYDRERLKSGMNFQYELEDEVSKRCSLFVSVISRSTESQHEAYFLREREWAAQRALGWADARRAEFYHPVVIDELPLGAARHEPRVFQGCQQTHLSSGNVTPDFGQRLARLQQTLRAGKSV